MLYVGQAGFQRGVAFGAGGEAHGHKLNAEWACPPRRVTPTRL